MAPKKSKKEKQAEKEAELARLAEEQRLEEERIAKEIAEEEARLAKELKERTDAETAAQTEFDALLDAETGANASFYVERKAALEKERLISFERDDWAVFIACEPLPDVQREADVNTFLTEWGEKPRDGAEALDKTLADCTLCTELLRSLQLEAAFSAARLEPKQAAWQHEIQLRLKAEMQRKLDGATADFLTRADEFANAKHECIVCVPAAGCRFGLWVNLAKNPRIKSIEYAELSVASELPKALALASIAVRVTQYAIDFVSPYANAEAREASPWMTLGGILQVDLLTLPPPSKKVKGWTMRPVTEMTNSVVTMQYPIPNADGQLPPPGTAPPLRISLYIDPSVILPEKVQHVGHWNAESQSWAQEEISDVEYEADSRKLIFSTTSLTSLALLQPTHLELPYKDWIFLPRDAASGSLHVKTQRFDIHIDVSIAGCVLRGPDRPELAALIGVPMAASKLLLRLRSCGINLQPKDSDAPKLTKITPKEGWLEKELHEALTPIIGRYQLAPSRWNQSRGVSKLTVRLSPSDPVFDADEEVAPPPSDPYAASLADWPCLEFSKKKAIMVNALDADATCDETPLKDGIAHSTPLECLKGDDPELLAMQVNASRVYQDTVRQLLDELRLFSFTSA